MSSAELAKRVVKVIAYLQFETKFGSQGIFLGSEFSRNAVIEACRVITVFFTSFGKTFFAWRFIYYFVLIDDILSETICFFLFLCFVLKYLP